MRQIEKIWFPTGRNSGRIVLKLTACDSISQAESLTGQELLLPGNDLPSLDPDTFFVRDLLGCELYDGASHAGRIVDVQFATSADGRKRLEDAAPLLAIARHPLQQVETTEAASEEDSALVPFVRAWLQSVDVAARRVVMHLPAGLLDWEKDPENDR